MKILIGDVAFHLEESGDGPGRPLLLLHGFLGASTTWSNIIESLSERRRCIAVDLLGHGDSSAPADWQRYSMTKCVADIWTLVRLLEVELPIVLGYSMGGRVAMRLTLERSDGVTAVIFESANPGIENDNDRVARLVHDEALARRIELEGMESFLEYWESLPLFESQHRLPEHDRQRVRRQRLATSPIGAANSMRGLSQGRQLPMWDALAALAVPTLVVAGADDATYARIALRLEQTMPQIRVDIIPSAGHTVHLEQPAAFLASVTTFLKQIDDEERIESRAATAMAAKGNV